MRDTQEIKKVLEERRKFLTDQVKELEADLRAPHSADWEERASETEGDEVLEGLERSAVREINQINAALQRIEDGSYGWCDTCGEPIGEARQAALIYALQCIKCAEASGR